MASETVGMNDSIEIVPVSDCSNFEDHCRGRLHEQQCVRCVRGAHAMQGDLIFSEIHAGALARAVQERHACPSVS